MVPIQIRAQALHQWPLTAEEAAFQPLAMTPQDHPAQPGESDTPGGAPRWRQADVKRAIAAAEQAGLQSYRVEIAPDGTISIVVGAPAQPDDSLPDNDLLDP